MAIKNTCKVGKIEVTNFHTSEYGDSFEIRQKYQEGWVASTDNPLMKDLGIDNTTKSGTNPVKENVVFIRSNETFTNTYRDNLKKLEDDLNRLGYKVVALISSTPFYDNNIKWAIENHKITKQEAIEKQLVPDSQISENGPRYRKTYLVKNIDQLKNFFSEKFTKDMVEISKRNPLKWEPTEKFNFYLVEREVTENVEQPINDVETLFRP